MSKRNDLISKIKEKYEKCQLSRIRWIVLYIKEARRESIFYIILVMYLLRGNLGHLQNNDNNYYGKLD